MTQDEALEIMKTGANVFLSGEPGSGKTYTVNRYIEHLKRYGIETAVTASTGIAATHVGGMTIHSWSGIAIKRDLTEDELDAIAFKPGVARRVGKAKVLIIDEVSMLDAQVLDVVERVCSRVRGSSNAFGGLQVIFVGDFFQLPPVRHQGEPQADFAFDSAAWAKAEPAICNLDEQHRQTDGALYEVLRSIRSGFVDDAIREQLQERHGHRPEREEHVPELYTHNVDVDRINTAKLRGIEGDTATFTMTSSGRALFVEQLKRGCLSPEVLELKEGALVMFTKNSQDGSFVNGTLGTVEGFAEGDGIPLVRTRSGRLIGASPLEWAMEIPGVAAAKITQVPLRLAWAMTVHKSQGMSMDAALMDLSRAFEFGQGYVALSRVRTLDGLFLLGVNEQAMKVHPQVLAREEAFRRDSEAARAALAGLAPEELLKRQEAFITRLGGKLRDPAMKPKYDLNKLRETHAKAYRPWSEEEERELLKHFDAGLAHKSIAALLRRQIGGVRARLKKLGKIE
jgi:hypothetical protein